MAVSHRYAWPLIGRDAELAVIAGALRDEGCQGVVVTAPAGVGKSRLAREAYAAADGFLAGWVQATRSAAAVPLGAFAPLLPEQVRADDTLELMRRSADALSARAEGRRVVLGVDDAQLLDGVSAALLLHLASHAGVFVLATVRSGEPCPDAVVSLWKDGAARVVELATLSERDVTTLVEAALGGPVEEAALRWVAESSQGNALYAHELIVGAVEAGTLAAGDGIWRLRGRPAVSRSLGQLIGARLADLDAEQRAPVELLALGEPLRLAELASLTTHDALLEAEAHGLVVMDTREELRLAHPLFGEVVSAALPSLRARALRLQLASKLRERTPPGADDALRIARLLLDAGEPIPPDLQLQAARAANLAGDPDLGAELATLALGDGGLPAALLLARAHTMRNRNNEAEQVLGAAEPLAPGHDNAFDYLMQRVWVLYWSLHRNEAMHALFGRAATWSPDAVWAERVEQLRRSYVVIADGWDGPPAELENPALEESTRRSLVALEAVRMVFSGDGDQASALARRIRPPVPLRDLADLACLGASCMVPMETGNDWPDYSAYMADSLAAAVRVNHHESAGIAAFTLAAFEFLRGRFRDAARWLAEAELHFAHQDTFGSMIHVRCYQLGIAYFTDDLDGLPAAVERLEAAIGGRELLPNQLPYVLRAQGWAARARSDAEAARIFLAGAERIEASPLFAASLAYEAQRAGAKSDRVVALAARCRAPLASAFAAHANARDGAALLAAAEAFAAIGADRYALEAATEAASTFLREGRRDSAQRAAARARELFADGQGAAPPRIDGLEEPAVELTAREAQIASLAGRGLSNAEIADRLILSIRTVESHVYRAMQKRGVSDRRAL